MEEITVNGKKRKYTTKEAAMWNKLKDIESKLAMIWGKINA